MIFEEVVLHNFGVYKGRVSVNLSVSAERPVILIGALNGSGKTTFLDAMQLALYGKSAKCTGREKVGYLEYLESMINRDVSTTEGAGIEFSFRTRVSGQDSQIRVIRTWKKRGQGLQETLEVLRDGDVDAVASERWQEFVEDFMPSQIADLFFFDGEKIEALADPARSAALLKVGVHSLLGIDLIESLVRSLQQVERKRKGEAAPKSERVQLESLHAQALAMREELGAAKQRAAALTTDLDSARQRVEVATAEFKRLGGDLYNRRAQLETSHQEFIGRETLLEDQLREIAGGNLPLGLLQQLLNLTMSKAELQQKFRNTQVLLEEATIRDNALLVFIKSLEIKASLTKQVDDFLTEDRASRYVEKDLGLRLPAGVFVEYSSDELKRSQRSAATVLRELSDVKERLAALDRNLAAIPAESVIAQAQHQLEMQVIERATLEAKRSIAFEEVANIEGKLERCDQHISKESNRIGDLLLKEDISRRVITHSTLARETLGRFRDRLLQENLGRLQDEICVCFKKLLRKKNLVQRVLIDPESFQLTVIDQNARSVSSRQLSAGERQLLAIATVWALSHASGRHLPAVVDTPLSRLDSAHRGTIVQNYFPMASHQVILLSTDEEVVGKYYKSLIPHIGCQYLIEHDEEKNTSRFTPGYFANWRELAAA